MGPKYKVTKKDIVIIMFFLVIVIGNIVIYFSNNGFENIGGIIEQTILIMLSFVTLVDIASYANWSIFVPDFFDFAKEKKHKIEIKDYMEAYMKEDINFFKDYSDEKINFLLTQLGVSRNQLDKIRLELVRMRCTPLKSLADAKEKIRSLLVSDYPFVVNQDDFDSSKISYCKVKYFVNITDIMFIPEYASELSSILAFLIAEKADLTKIDKVVIPYDSNFLLGLEVGRRLGKSVVKMRYSEGKVERDKCWDGNLYRTDRVIIIHDVLVSGNQIIHATNKLPDTCSVEGFYCLIARKEWKGKEAIIKKGINCYEIVEIDDNDIIMLKNKL